MGKGYPKEYYENYDMGEAGVVNYIESEHLRVFMTAVAGKIVEDFHPKSILDAGCALGILVAELRKRGVDAYGIDYSDYAIENADPIARSFCVQGSIADPIPDVIPQKYDLITCIEVLEHMSEEDGKKAIKNLCKLSDTIIFCSTPDDYEDPTHINVRQRPYWAEAFADNGFYDDLLYRPTYLATYAVCYRKRDSFTEQVRVYEQYTEETDRLLNERIKQINDLTKANNQEVVCTVFFESKDGFSEEDSHKINRTIKGGIDNAIVIIEDIIVPLGCKRVRIDPCEDHPCTVDHISILYNGEILEPQIVNGFSIERNILFATEDPQLLVDLPESSLRMLHLDMNIRLYSPQDPLLGEIKGFFNKCSKEMDNQIQEASRKEAVLRQEIEAKAQVANQTEAVLRQEIKKQTQEATQREAELRHEIEVQIQEATQRETILLREIETQTQKANQKEAELRQTMEAQTQEANQKEAELRQTMEAQAQEANQKEAELRKTMETQAQEANQKEAELRQQLEIQIQEKNKKETEFSNLRKAYRHRLIEQTAKTEEEVSKHKQTLEEKNIIQQTANDRLNQINNLAKEIENQKNENTLLFSRCENAEKEYERISNSSFWKVTKPARIILDKIKKGLQKNQRLYLFLLSKKWRIKYGKEETSKRKNEYLTWLKMSGYLTPEEKKEYKKLFSILVPLYNTPEQYLRDMIESVLSQTCPEWELCLADASDDLHSSVGEICKEYASHDARIKYKHLKKNLMISGNTNMAAQMASGEYLALLDHDDLLNEKALEEYKIAIQENDWDVLYSDEDHLLPDGQHGNPFYKPDWSPDLLNSQMYICHFLAMKKELFKSIGGFRKEFDGSQDYDLMLRMSEKTDRIHHISKILYTWRESELSTAINPDSKPYAQYAGKKALDEHLKRVYGDTARADETEYLYVYDARYPLLQEPKASIIIPMKDKWELTDACIKSIIEKTTWNNYEILILNNRSEKNGTKRWFKKIREQYPSIRIIDADMEFNWSKLNNFGMKHAKGDLFIFLNNDTLVITPDWIERLAEKALRKGIGVVGALLLYEDDTIQHAGVVVGIGGWADHVFKGMKPIHYGAPFVSPMVSRNVLAVTGACMAVSRKTIEFIGPFDESFQICGSDVELGIRAHEKGLYNVYDASVRLYHLESKSRDSYIPEQDFKRSYECYTPYREGCDPYFNPNLDMNSTTPIIKEAIDREYADQVTVRPEIDTEVPQADTVEYSCIEEIAYIPQSEVGEILRICPRIDKDEMPRINLLIPSVDEKHVFGGIATALHFFEKLCNKTGWDRRIITTDAPIDLEHMVLSEEYSIVNWNETSIESAQAVAFNDRVKATLPVREKDIFIATGWWTAYTIQEVILWQQEIYWQDCPNELIYFIQDFEPGFYPWSSRYLIAESTYKMSIPVYAIFNSGLLKNYFDKQGFNFKKTWCFEPVLNAELKKYLPSESSVKKKKQILIYGRPGTPRNAFELVCMSLRRFIAKNPEEYAKWSFLSAGEIFTDVDLGFGVVLHSVGKLTLKEYANTMLDTYAAISLMASPHPSYPPLEMSTFGVKTITNCFYNKDLCDFNENIISISVCSEEVIAEKLNSVCKLYQPNVSWKINSQYIAKSHELDDIAGNVSTVVMDQMY